VIIDSHAHIFPFLGAPAGYASSAEHLRWLQLYVATHGQPARRLRDHGAVSERGLADLPITGQERLRSVDFRVEENGRFVWRDGKEQLYTHFMPPSLQTNSSSAEYLLTEMAYADVDVAILQNAHLYGRLNEYFASASARYPGRFIGLAEVDEARAGDPSQVAHLRSAVRDLGLRGLYYANRGLLPCGYRYGLDDERFEPLWEEIARLGVPIFWEILGLPDSSEATLLAQLDRLDRWADRHPEIPCVYTHGFAPGLLREPIPEPVHAILHRQQFLIEVLYPISWGREHEYPYTELEGPLRTLVREVGASRLVWGSDMPNVLRHCTYAQSLEYLRRHLRTIGCRDVDNVLSGNLRQLFGIEG
jgi:predicted TIM-barrel fold metal-dependent hydrolase